MADESRSAHQQIILKRFEEEGHIYYLRSPVEGVSPPSDSELQTSSRLNKEENKRLNARCNQPKRIEDKVVERNNFGRIVSDEMEKRRAHLAPPLAAARADSILSTHT